PRTYPRCHRSRDDALDRASLVAIGLRLATVTNAVREREQLRRELVARRHGVRARLAVFGDHGVRHRFHVVVAVLHADLALGAYDAVVARTKGSEARRELGERTAREREHGRRGLVAMEEPRIAPGEVGARPHLARFFLEQVARG